MELKEKTIGMEQSLHKVLKPFYKELLEQLSKEDKEATSPFCIEWGKNFPTDSFSGLLFIGRATNGWGTDSTESVDVLFDGDNESRGFAHPNQMSWLENHPSYNWQRSAFWRVVSNVSQSYTQGEWFNGIAWTNLYKIAPYDGGNPSNRLCYEQLPICQKILKNEIEILSPKFVILLTGENWAKDFLPYLNGEKECNPISTIEWGKNNEYLINLYNFNGVYFLQTEHPQGKDEESHINAIVSIIEKYK